MSLGERISARLHALGKSQSWLAREVGLHQSTVNGIIRGGQRNTTHIVQMAYKLLTSPEYLTGQTDDPDVEVVLPDLSYEQRQLLACFEALDETGRQLVLAMAMRLAGMDGPGRIQNPRLDYHGEYEGAR